MAYDDIAADDRLAYNRAILAAYHAYLRDDRPDPVHVRAVYDAAARILNDNGTRTVNHILVEPPTDLWQLRAAYIDAHANLLADNHNSDHNFRAARDALVAATTAGHTMT
jgi:hypothetical protein